MIFLLKTQLYSSYCESLCKCIRCYFNTCLKYKHRQVDLIWRQKRMILLQIKRSPVFLAAFFAECYKYVITHSTCLNKQSSFSCRLLLWLRISISMVIFIVMNALFFSLKKSWGKNGHSFLSFFLGKKCLLPRLFINPQEKRLRHQHPTWSCREEQNTCQRLDIAKRKWFMTSLTIVFPVK